MQAFHSAWRSKMFLRSPHDSLLARLFAHPNNGGLGFYSGLYFIGCDDKIIYIGQSVDISRRLVESLGRIYHQIPDTKLPWSVAFAALHTDANELESTAIRKYAPVFNTSIPNKLKSQGEMPILVGIAPIFADQAENTGQAFNSENMERQSAEALENPSPPWLKGNSKRRSSEEVRAELEAKILEEQGNRPEFVWDEETKKEAMQEVGVPIDAPLRFKINLVEDGSVVTEDGEYIGSWELDENGFAYFTPDGSSEVMLTDPFVGLLCKQIEDWHYENGKNIESF